MLKNSIGAVLISGICRRDRNKKVIKKEYINPLKGHLWMQKGIIRILSKKWVENIYL